MSNTQRPAEGQILSRLNAALLEGTPRESRLILYVIVLMTIGFLVWAQFSELDEITRGVGKIVPMSKIQVVQNLEGGIVQEILVQPGETVDKGQPLLRIVNKTFESNFGEGRLKLEELRLRRIRLLVETGIGTFSVPADLASAEPDLLANERSLLSTNIGYLDNQILIIRHQIEQRRSEIVEAETRIRNLRLNKELLDQQVDITKPLVDKGIESRTEYLRLQREQATLRESIEGAQASIPRFRAAIAELEGKITDLRISFRTRAQKELNEVSAQISQAGEKQSALKDQVTRTLVLSPVRGIVKQMFVNTIHGVVKPGMDLVEIVPIEDALQIEAKIQPSDIAFVHLGQRAMVKVTAYDYSIYGGLEGAVYDISADTLTEPNGMTYYLVRIRTGKNYLAQPDKPLKTIPGMMVTVDIMTGKKSVLDYLMKPIMRAKQNALTER